MSNDSRCMPLPRQDGEAAKDLQELHRCHAWYILVLRQTGLKSCQVSSQKVWHDNCWWFNSWFLYIYVSYYTISSQSLYRFIAYIYICIEIVVICFLWHDDPSYLKRTTGMAGSTPTFCPKLHGCRNLKRARYSGNVRVLMQRCDVSSQDAVHSLAQSLRYVEHWFFFTFSQQLVISSFNRWVWRRMHYALYWKLTDLKVVTAKFHKARF